LVDPRPYDVPARLWVLPGDEPTDVTLHFTPFAKLGARNLFDSHAPAPGEPARVHVVWKGPPAPPATLRGELIRDDADDDPVDVIATAQGANEIFLTLPEGRWRLSGSMGGRLPVFGIFSLVAGEQGQLDLSGSLAMTRGLLSSIAEERSLTVHDEAGRPRLHYALTTTPSDPPFLPDRRRGWFRGGILTRVQFVEPDHPPTAYAQLRYVDGRSIPSSAIDVVIEAFGCATLEIERVPLGGREPREFELSFEESPAASW
jgi:hypothetical protein